MRNAYLRHITDGATAIGRAFGRERPGLLDVLQFLADVRTPAGARLAAVGLTEQAIVSWRRSVDTGAPLLAVDQVAVGPDLDRLLGSVVEKGPILTGDRARALVGTELVSWPETQPDVALLLDSFDIDRSRLSADLARSADDRASFPFPRGHPGLSIYQHVDHTVFVPCWTRPDEFQGELPSLATRTDLDLPAQALGDQVLAGFAKYGLREEDSAEPFWAGLGFKTESAFLRRARLVMATRYDFSVAFHATAHLGRLRYDVISDITPVWAPIDDTDALGEALRTAVRASQG